MKQLTAFIKKEFLEQFREGRFLILGILFCLFGIMSPAIAKLTPWLFDLMSEQLAETGMVMTSVEVNALTSWAQFFKNLPVLMIIVIVLFGGILTTEYQRGTLINMITKGLKRWKILISKWLLLAVFWTGGYLLMFGITYAYNAYFWDNQLAQNLFFAVFGYYLVGQWLLSIVILASAVFQSISAVTLSVGAGVALSYLFSFLPALSKYVPTFLLSSTELLAGTSDLSQYFAAVGITIALMIVNGILAVLFFNKRKI